MDNLLGRLLNGLKHTNGGHILYHFNAVEKYLYNVVSYIVTGIENGDYILLVENDRNIQFINQKLQMQLSKEQLDKVRFVNNFDFYYFNGDFHPHTVLNYFKKNVEPFIEDGASVRTWGLIEWGDDKEITNKVEEYERELDKLVKEKGIISVCAYDANRTTKSLKEALMRCHGVMMTDSEIIHLSKENWK